MTDSTRTTLALTQDQLDSFVRDGFVRLDEAFPRDLAEQARLILWRDLGLDPEDPAGWTRPVVRLGMYADPPFRAAASTPRLQSAFDQLVGPGAWQPVGAVGTFPVRFPSDEDPGDAGWHIDVSFGGDPSDFLSWRANWRSRGRALLLLFLFSDVGPEDAPTRIRAGSHRHIARVLAPAGEEGLALRDLLPAFEETADCPEALATGPAGTVYLCHPLLVHAAQPHRGRVPRFMAQPPLLPTRELDPNRPESELSPVERAIRLALD